MNATLKNISTLCGVTMLLASGLVRAEDSDSKPWQGDAELGIIKTSGNTTTQSITTRAGITYEQDHWRHNAKIEVLNSSNSNVTTAERYLVTGKSDYKMDLCELCLRQSRL